MTRGRRGDDREGRKVRRARAFSWREKSVRLELGLAGRKKERQNTVIQSLGAGWTLEEGQKGTKSCRESREMIREGVSADAKANAKFHQTQDTL